MADQFNILDRSNDWLTGSDLTTGEVSLNRRLVTGAVNTATQRLILGYFTAKKSEPITQAAMICSSTAAGATPTLVRVGIWTANTDGSLSSLVASTANDTTLLAATFTTYTKALQATWNKQAGQLYAVGLLVVTGAAAPNVYGSGGLFGQEAVFSPILAATVAGQADLPSTLAAGSLSGSNAGIPYVRFIP